MTTRAGVGLGFISTPFSRLVLSPLRKISSFVLDRVADLFEGEAADAFWYWRVPIAIFNDKQQVKKYRCKYR